MQNGTFKILEFKYHNCGAKSDPIQLDRLSLEPDPIEIPGDIRLAISGNVTKTLKAPITVSHDAY